MTRFHYHETCPLKRILEINEVCGVNTDVDPMPGVLVTSLRYLFLCFLLGIQNDKATNHIISLEMQH